MRWMKPTTMLIVLAWAGFVAITLPMTEKDAMAIPMFARRLGVPCSTCHTSPPRLNETGYRFRAAGFRMPEEIGKSADTKNFKITDHIGFRLQPRYLFTRSSMGAEKNVTHKANLFAAEGYFWYGPISKYFSSNFKVTIWPDESGETELTERVEGTIRFQYGSADNFLDLRAGVPHPEEGFGGSESYILSDTRPFIQELRTANFNQDTFFTPFGFHQTGVTAGYYRKRTTVRAQLTSGIRIKEEKGMLEPFGRRDFTSALAQSNKGGPDLQLYFNQILHADGGNISAYYYNGRSYLPRLDLLPPGTTVANVRARPDIQRSGAQGLDDLAARPPDDPLSRSVAAGHILAETGQNPDLSNLPFFKNSFHRLALYAGYPIRRVNLLYGIQKGRDTIGSGGHFTSLGHFAEASVKTFNDISAVGLRYDWFDPARNKVDNEITGVTAYVNVWLHSELRITPEYQHLVVKNGASPNRTDDRIQLRLYWVR